MNGLENNESWDGFKECEGREREEVEGEDSGYNYPNELLMVT